MHIPLLFSRAVRFAGRRIPKGTRLPLFIINAPVIVFFVLALSLPLPPQKERSAAFYADDGALLTAYLTPSGRWCLQTRLKEVSPDLITAILAKEDHWFFYHGGVNPLALARALLQNIFAGKRASGASTITMQLCRMLEPKNRTYFSKVLEVFRAAQFELRYSKNEILEMYLSSLPYGGNIEGVTAASWLWFNRPPSKLSLAQVTTLAVIPNDPNRYRPDRGIQALRIKRDTWLQRFRRENVFSTAACNDALLEDIPGTRGSIPVNAPHFSRYLSSLIPAGSTQTTLSIPLQQQAELLLRNYVRRVWTKGVTQGAVLIVENKTMAVKAYCGSEEFTNSANAGQVNGITAVRSPGSTLKPALYAQAMDYGTITPLVTLTDIPMDFGSYRPENFDSRFRGEVSVAYALLNSLNLPAVKLLNETGLGNFVTLLSNAGLSSVKKEKEQLGLSVILGGCGARLDELVRLYASFANSGRLRPLRFTANAPRDSGAALFSAAATWLIADILSGNSRPDFPADYIEAAGLPKIAWKTGTSFAKKDAWAIGWSPRYTIGVWMGNFDGKGSPFLSGAEMAVPLLFSLFSAAEHGTHWYPKPELVQERTVCAASGLPPGPLCSAFIKDFFIRGVSRTSPCNAHKAYFTDAAGSVRYCPSCRPDSGYLRVVFPEPDRELFLWQMHNKVAGKLPPPHYPLCPAAATGFAPRILSPAEGNEYYIQADTPQQILLEAAPAPGTTWLYWYIDGSLFTRTAVGEKAFFLPRLSEHRITCMDDLGRVSRTMLRVKKY